MRRFPKILIFALSLFVLTAQGARAMDALLGEVISINAENRQMVVSVDQSGEADGARRVLISYNRQSLPGFVQPGAVVRVWGEYVDENHSELRLQSVRNGEGIHRGHDSTGVRSRLKHGHGGRGMGMGRNHGGGRH
ncbi:MAG: hypothetical protein U5L07_14345 [Desulfobacterales bacterium]|nr:hypothetical protein [Desulfobacterales bacterium]